MSSKYPAPLIAFLAICAFSQTVIGVSAEETKEASYVVAEDGLVVMYVSSPIGAGGMFFVHFEGVAKRSDGSALSITKDQENEIREKIERRLSEIKISEFGDESIKDDMRTVFEEDLKEILSLDTEPQIQITQLIVSSNRRRG